MLARLEPEPRPVRVVLGVITAAWLLVALRDAPAVFANAPRLLGNLHSLNQWWTILNSFLAVGLPPIAATLWWFRREALAAFVLAIVGASWILWEIIDQQLLILKAPWCELAGVDLELLSLLTLIAVGGYGAYRATRR